MVLFNRGDRLLVCLCALWVFSASVHAQQEPLHSAEEILAAVYVAAEVEPQTVKVMLMNYDYLKGLWHIELTSAETTCIDCYPSFYVENQPELTVIAVPHG